MITYNTNPDCNTIDWHEVRDLFRLVEWDERRPKDIRKAFEQSSQVIVAIEGETIVGFGRTVDDGQYYALIVDVVVRPSHQSRGIGKHIVNYLRDSLKGYQFVTLTAAPQKDGFYINMGWKKQKSSYIWPKDEKQMKEHCEPS